MTRPDRPRDLRPLWVGLAVLIGILAAAETVALFRIIDEQQAVGADLRYYQDVARRWLDTGVYYTDRQLAGPYVVQTEVDNLYPPHALYLFVPFLFLPQITWWILPLGFIGYVVWWCRPAAWVLPLLALAVLYPKAPTQVIYGNTDMWLTAFIAGGVRWGWPAILVTIKPSVSVFALIGIRSRGWWIAAGVLVLLSLPLIGLWLQYPTVTRNSSAAWYYSFGNLPFFLLPIIAWLGSTRRGSIQMPTWGLKLLGAERA